MFPKYLDQPPLTLGRFGKFCMSIVQIFLRAFVWLVLRPRLSKVGSLNPDEVMSVYDREARTYDAKHHLTTRGQDLMWRREAAWCALNKAQSLPRRIQILDLCTGTGLTVREIVKVFRLHHLAADVVGLDLNEAMLNVARKREDIDSPAISFVRGDATDLDYRNEFDFVAQVFGIGGIPQPHLVLLSAIRALRPGGQYYLVDMHRPIPELAGEWPFFFRWLSSPILEAATYYSTTMPLVLARLWGWRDTTFDFYRAPLTVCPSSSGQYYGFAVRWFKIESERWWLSLPIMPTARILLEKVRISREEAARRIYKEDLLKKHFNLK